MDIRDTLFQSLLRQQNISDFMPLCIDINSVYNTKSENYIKINHKYVNLGDLYGYIKDAAFHICDNQFSEICLSDFNLEEKGLHLIEITEEAYCYPSQNCEKSIVVKSDGSIVCKKPQKFFYVGTNEFLIDAPEFINDYEEGIIFDFTKKTFIRPTTSTLRDTFQTNYDTKIPTLTTKTLVENEENNSNLQYLFSIKKTHLPYILCHIL